MSSGDWRAELAWRVISSPAAKEFATNVLASKGWLAPKPTTTAHKSSTMTEQEKQVLKAGRDILKQFADFLDTRALEVERTIPNEVELMNTELVQHWLQRQCERLMDKEEWKRQDLTRLSAVLFWMAVAMAPVLTEPEEKKGPNK